MKNNVCCTSSEEVTAQDWRGLRIRCVVQACFTREAAPSWGPPCAYQPIAIDSSNGQIEHECADFGWLARPAGLAHLRAAVILRGQLAKPSKDRRGPHDLAHIDQR
jgi:hypothetical protein